MSAKASCINATVFHYCFNTLVSTHRKGQLGSFFLRRIAKIWYFQAISRNSKAILEKNLVSLQSTEASPFDKWCYG